MKRRLLFFAGCLAAVLAVGYGVLWWTGPNPLVTIENFRKVQLGMSEAEVEKIFGSRGGLWDPDKEDEILQALGVEPALDSTEITIGKWMVGRKSLPGDSFNSGQPIPPSSIASASCWAWEGDAWAHLATIP